MMKVGKCHAPLANGSDCHVCRIAQALIAAELASNNKGPLDAKRCVEALTEVLARFLSEANEFETWGFLTDLYGMSRHYRDEDDPLAHPMGHA
jgi:hypothetical protein